jgi:hypothetical protein
MDDIEIISHSSLITVHAHDVNIYDHRGRTAWKKVLTIDIDQRALRAMIDEHVRQYQVFPFDTQANNQP